VGGRVGSARAGSPLGWRRRRGQHVGRGWPSRRADRTARPHQPPRQAVPETTCEVYADSACRSWPGCGSPGDPDHTPLILARELLDLVTAHLGDRPVHLVGDAASIGKPLQGLPAQVTVTAGSAATPHSHKRAPARTGRRGRPRVKATGSRN
jgi:hypothetical protein